MKNARNPRKKWKILPLRLILYTLARRHFNPPRCGSDHIYHWNVFAGDPYRAISVRDLRRRLREARVQADYENLISNLPRFAEGAIMDAEDLQEALDALAL